MTRVATIDIGTNTTLLLVAEKNAEGSLVAIEEQATITRLGEGVDKTRALAPAAIERTNACLDRYAEIVKKLGVRSPECVAVVGTSAMRDAGGGDAVRAHVKERFGVDARTISGDEEARLTFAGALSGLTTEKRVTVFDIGGGSTEVVEGDRDTLAIAYAHSFDVGSVRLTERHGESMDALLAAARAAFDPLPALALEGAPVGIAGTMTTLAAVSMEMTTYDGARVHGSSLTTDEVRAVVDMLARKPLEERKRTPGLEPKRADVIVAGGVVALAFLEKVGAKSVTISDRGVRWGLAEEISAKHEKK